MKTWVQCVESLKVSDSHRAGGTGISLSHQMWVLGTKLTEPSSQPLFTTLNKQLKCTCYSAENFSIGVVFLGRENNNPMFERSLQTCFYLINDLISKGAVFGSSTITELQFRNRSCPDEHFHFREQLSHLAPELQIISSLTILKRIYRHCKNYGSIILTDYPKVQVHNKTCFKKFSISKIAKNISSF